MRNGVRGVAAATLLMVCVACGSQAEEDDAGEAEPSRATTGDASSAAAPTSPTPTDAASSPAATPSSPPVEAVAPLDFPDDPQTASDTDLLSCRLLTPDIASSVISGVAFFDSGGKVEGLSFGSCTYNGEPGVTGSVQLSLDRVDDPGAWKTELESSFASQATPSDTITDAPAGLGEEGIYLASGNNEAGVLVLAWRSGSIAMTMKAIYLPGGGGPPETALFAAADEVFQEALVLSS